MRSRRQPRDADAITRDEAAAILAVRVATVATGCSGVVSSSSRAGT